MARYVLLHGFGGVGPDHWLVWLSTELRARGHAARIRKLPSPQSPSLAAWLTALDERLARITSDDPVVRGEPGSTDGELVVVAHSLATHLWLAHAARHDQPAPIVADRVALVVPPRLPKTAEAVGFGNLDLTQLEPSFVARHTRVALSSDDPWWPALGADAGIAAPLGLPVDLLGAAGHVEPKDGYGPWPSMLAWCLGERPDLSG